MALLALAGCGSAHASLEPTMPEDVRRMHERLVALSEGNGPMGDLRIEFIDGGMSAHRSFRIEAGKLVSNEWKSPGSAMIRREGDVPDSRVIELLRALITKRYWTFQGTRFTPDAPMFLFRFSYRDSSHVDFRCDLDELRESEARESIRNLFLEFVSETEMKAVPAK